jgi:RNA polymerase primary sigma factor
MTNLRLVIKIAHDYENLGVPLLDLINEGNQGLMKAVQRFDPRKGGKLSTYGSWWIKQAIKRALANQSKTIRLPVHQVDKLCKMRRTALKLQERHGREPTDNELAKELDWPVSKVSQLRRMGLAPVSFDAKLGNEEDSATVEEIIEDAAPNPAQQFLSRSNVALVKQVVASLDPREALILTRRFGLDGGSEKTLEEVGKQFKVTRERIRQIQNKALKKARRFIECLDKM